MLKSTNKYEGTSTRYEAQKWPIRKYDYEYEAKKWAVRKYEDEYEAKKWVIRKYEEEYEGKIGWYESTKMSTKKIAKSQH